MRHRVVVPILAILGLVLLATPADAAGGKSMSIQVNTSVNESDLTVVVTVTRSTPGGTPSVRIRTSDNTAAAPSDFTALDETVMFAKGSRTVTRTVTLNNDTTSETSESFLVVISTTDKYRIPDNFAQVFIDDNDAPAASTGLVATKMGSNQIDLTWDTPSDFANLWEVKRGTVSGGPYTNTLADAETNSYSDMTALPDTTYYYVVTAIANGRRATSFSNEASATTDPET